MTRVPVVAGVLAGGLLPSSGCSIPTSVGESMGVPVEVPSIDRVAGGGPGAIVICSVDRANFALYNWLSTSLIRDALVDLLTVARRSVWRLIGTLE